MQKEKTGNLAWIDLEMTGLQPERNRIIEIAAVVTDDHLELVAEGPVLAISQNPEFLADMDDWNTEHHTRSGLLERVRDSTIDEAEAEKQMLAFLRRHLMPKESPICGNSICQDRRFLYRYMPDLEAFFHYRNLDVSTVKELARRWAPEIKKGFSKRKNHRALDDIYESIDELRYYRRNLFGIH